MLLPAIAGSLFYRKLSVKTRWLVLLMIAACIPQMVVAYVQWSPSLEIREFKQLFWFYNGHLALDFVFIALYFNKQFAQSWKTNVYRASVVASVILGLILISSQGLSLFLNEWLVFNYLCYTVWTLMLMHDIYGDQNVMVQGTPQFFYLMALFFGKSCTVPLFSLYDYVGGRVDSMLRELWIIQDILNPIHFLLLALGFLLEYRQSEKLKLT